MIMIRQEKMTTGTDPNQWMIVKDINGEEVNGEARETTLGCGKITSGREVVGNHMILNTGTTASDTIQALKTFDINNDGKVDSTDECFEEVKAFTQIQFVYKYKELAA